MTELRSEAVARQWGSLDHVHSFPQALVSCIRDARTPAEEELVVLRDRLWDEGIAHLPTGTRQLADQLAFVALAGSQEQFGRYDPEAARVSESR